MGGAFGMKFGIRYSTEQIWCKGSFGERDFHVFMQFLKDGLSVILDRG